MALLLRALAVAHRGRAATRFVPQIAAACTSRRWSTSTIEWTEEPSPTVVVHPYTKEKSRALREKADAIREHELAEASNLARALPALKVVNEAAMRLHHVHADNFMGLFRLDELRAMIDEHRDAHAHTPTVVCNAFLSSMQQHHMQEHLDCEVVDRFALILRIFQSRARSKEAQIQVKLAELAYEKAHLRATDMEHEQQRGGVAAVGGEGEQHIELQRRHIGEREYRLKKELKQVRKTRELHREHRRKMQTPIVSMCGYTNAGKTHLMTQLTGDEHEAPDNKLFATLDTSLRAAKLPSTQECVVVDTVGFIHNLPHPLVDAFRSTLEEVREADLMLMVRDLDDPLWDMHRDDVLGVLREIGVPHDALRSRMVEVWNKVDLVDEALVEQRLAEHQESEHRARDVVCVSAKDGSNMDELERVIDAKVQERFGRQIVDVVMRPGEGWLQGWLYKHGKVVECVPAGPNQDALKFSVLLDAAGRNQLAHEMEKRAHHSTE